MSMLDNRYIPELTDGEHTMTLVNYTSGVSTPTPDGKGGTEFLRLTVKADAETFNRDSFTDRALFINEGVSQQRLLQGAGAQLGMELASLKDILEAMKKRPVKVTLSHVYSATTGKTYQNIVWNPIQAAATANPPAELPENIEL